ncbi:UDP-N-acetylmuramoyl-L-alanine--D-glutamate ligase [Pseudonocardia sp. KRD-184]|uniref:UDP-N-acetylmuramoylalanine--D-glutamate ligase n=3 Tax=Pseudonocardia oceani TaxID=2792013 RepID=A0ABS6UFL7_9PSEU|nr:UDP-N-acetylmuramoyl-L-alanine--D-glutamate ligase [Pseudonocardia oceani]MBW0092090.1 UDP-N-acetylmuramoyl-L-alanine--D-glutamate ligase [Pseudonocardia oceani]MBW0099090.1 UDP-N-acetylmuramoyl-L-alanine--D-glutamate ligase [Pseudonocardia oceani]MBW0121159.1 UDP-N-acetylmuramoyl-L-alanine--D-glutamate ligase [Pseudonocardia oceani]MBW0131025.1 UDP-N-acetylmuramoyl-L-alanine--D-glutamate ligase [Pseudonocardia oceani]
MRAGRVDLGDLRGAPVVVAGAGISGLAAARALLELGARVTVTDAVPERLTDLPDGAVAGAEDALPEGTALVVTGPGRRPDHPVTGLGVPVVGETELAWWLGAARPEPPAWLVVTGTNGKTTTTGMLEAVLRAAGLDAVACGNIGYPAVDAVRAGHRVLAVELSSFQLHWSPSIVPAAGCVLNVAEDHLDWHGSMDAYAAAKARALLGAVAVAGVDDARAAGLLAAAPAPVRVGVTLSEPAPGQLGVVDGTLVDRSFGDGVALLPASDVEPGGPPGVTDALAAAALARAHGVGPEAVRAGLAGFRPGRHRAERVGVVDGVTYVDDSKATNPHAAAASLAAVTAGRVVWIAGGLLKGASVDDLVARHASRLRGAVVIGADRSEIVAALARHAPEVPVSEVVAGDDGPMPSAVRRAAALAEPGDVVLLAPAAASMDQFRDYAARGQAFADAVAALADPARSGGVRA